MKQLPSPPAADGAAKPEAWHLQAGLAALLYVLVVAGIAIWTYWHAWRETLRSLDQKLLAGAASVRYVLADDFHDRATSSNAIAVVEDEQNIRNLSALARRSEFKFLYTVIQKDGHLRLTASSATAEELAAQEEVRYFDTYDEAQHLRTGVFGATSAVFVSYADRWGEFRAAFQPEVSPGGIPYVSAAEVDVGYVHAMLRQQFLEATSIAALLLLASLPLFLVYISKQRRHARALGDANTRLIHEMAERKLIEKELIRAHNMEALGNLAGGVAHDFNNILAAILGHAELALDIAGPHSPVAEDIEEIRRAGDRAKDLVRQILTYARKTGSEVKPVKVGAVAREVTRLIKSVIPSTIQLQAQVQTDACILADPVSLHQIFMNLCTNAIQAMAETGGLLCVDVKDIMKDADAGAAGSALPPGRYVQITVSDTGPGIPPGIQDSIFEPYFTTKSPGTGTGLGLAVVQGIVSSHGGTISVRSQPGQGAVFTVQLPVAADARIAVTSPEPDDDPLRGMERILVVDDERAVARTSARLLERLGYRAITCTDSEEALALLQANPQDFDLLVSDMTMPKMTGDKLAAAAVQAKPGLPVILCSGYSQKVEHLTPSDGVTKLLGKPFTGIDLARAVRTALDGRKASFARPERPGA